MELIKITTNKNGENAVNGRELHEFLGAGKKFADWIKGRITKYDFIEGEDYISVSQKREGNNATSIEYILTLDMAKELAMVENNDKGRQARKYFIEVEKKSKQPQLPANPMEVLELTFHALKEQKQEINTLKEDVTELKDNSPMYPIECKSISNAIKRRGVELMGGKDSNSYPDSSLRSKVYRALYERLRTEFGVSSYQGIKRKHYEQALGIAKSATLPIYLQDEVDNKNSQLRIF